MIAISACGHWEYISIQRIYIAGNGIETLVMDTFKHGAQIQLVAIRMNRSAGRHVGRW